MICCTSSNRKDAIMEMGMEHTGQIEAQMRQDGTLPSQEHKKTGHPYP